LSRPKAPAPRFLTRPNIVSEAVCQTTIGNFILARNIPFKQLGLDLLRSSQYLNQQGSAEQEGAPSGQAHSSSAPVSPPHFRQLAHGLANSGLVKCGLERVELQLVELPSDVGPVVASPTVEPQAEASQAASPKAEESQVLAASDRQLRARFAYRACVDCL